MYTRCTPASYNGLTDRRRSGHPSQRTDGETGPFSGGFFFFCSSVFVLLSVSRSHAGAKCIHYNNMFYGVTVWDMKNGMLQQKSRLDYPTLSVMIESI